MSNTDELLRSILQTYLTKSVTLSISNTSPFSAEPIFAAEIMVVLAVTGTIVVNGTVFVATAGVPYTFKFIDLRNISVTGSAAAVIYYPAHNQFPAVTPNGNW